MKTPRPGIRAQLYADTRPGRCVVCDEPLPPKRHPRRTMHRECLGAYFTMYGGLWREAQR